MTVLAEIVLFHQRHNGDIFIAHWYLWAIIIFFIVRLIVAVLDD